MAKSRIFLFLLLSFIIGVGVRSFVPVPVVFIWAGLVAGATAAILGILRKHRKAIILGFLAIALVSGIFRYEAAEKIKPDLSGLYGKTDVFRGIVLDEPERTQSVQRLKVGVQFDDSVFYSLVTVGRYPEYRIGDELELRGTLKEPENFADFNYVSYLSRDDIFSTMFFPEIKKIGEWKGNKLKTALSKIKHSFEEKIELAIPEPHSAFLKGLLLGERESLPDDLVENFKKTGTTHIVALSGYNITMVGRFFVASLLFLTVPFRLSFGLATAGIILFVILTGASPSVVRAGIMGILVLIAQREGRAYSMTNALVFAGAVMLLHNPKILRFDAAFQLSFLATAGLFYLSPHVESFLDRIFYFLRRRFNEDAINPKYIKERPDNEKILSVKQTFVETLSAQLAVLPLLIYLFGRVSLISPLTNILILIAVPYSMVLGFITGALGFLWLPFARVVGGLTWILLQYKISVIEFFARVPAASVELGQWVIVPISTFYLFGGWKLWKKSKRI